MSCFFLLLSTCRKFECNLPDCNGGVVFNEQSLGHRKLPPVPPRPNAGSASLGRASVRAKATIHGRVVGAVAMAIVFLLVIHPHGRPFLLVNTSPSLPLGLYWRTGSREAIRVGCLVDFPVPEPAYEYLHQRTGNTTHHWNILKPVVGIAGDRVCTCRGWLSINGTKVAPLVKTDSEGNPAPVWRGCRRLKDGEVFVLSTRVERSFDSRVYGPVRIDTVTGVYARLITSGETAGTPSGSHPTTERQEHAACANKQLLTRSTTIGK